MLESMSADRCTHRLNLKGLIWKNCFQGATLKLLMKLGHRTRPIERGLAAGDVRS